MSQKTRKTSTKTARKTAPQAAPTAAPNPVEVWRTARIVSATHIHAVTHHMEGSTSSTHSIQLGLADESNGRRIDFVSHLRTASDVAHLRNFLGPFDFPLVDERDLDAACKRLQGGTCEMLVTLDPTGTFAVGVREVAIGAEQVRGPDAHDDQDIWNHEIHWMRRKVSAEALRLLRRHDAECAAGRKEPE